eukprot:s531_g14.t1
MNKLVAVTCARLKIRTLQVKIGMRHIFSAEIDDAKRAYLLEAFEDAEHIFGDVVCFKNSSGFCYRCEQVHQIDSHFAVDLFLAGPSCKDLSLRNNGRSAFCGSYNDSAEDKGTSGPTYKNGFKAVSGWHVMGDRNAFLPVDTQKFLLRQRRNRIYGCVTVGTGDSDGAYFQESFPRVLKSLQTDTLFSMEQSFLQDLPREPLPSGRVKELIQKCEKNFAGIWRQDSENCAAFDRLLQDEQLCRDLAGNSFSSTVVQSALLSCLISCPAWKEIGVNSPNCNVQNNPKPCLKDVSECGAKRRKVDTQGHAHVQAPMQAPMQNQDHEEVLEETAELDQPSEEQEKEKVVKKKKGGRRRRKDDQEEELPVPLKRLRKKTSVALLPRKSRRGTGGTGNPTGKGKSQMATLAQKELIMKTFLESLENGVKNPARTVKHLPGYFRGCVYPSKWGDARKKQKWHIFTAAAPQICQKCKELPDSFRRILTWRTRHSSRSVKNSADPDRLHLPQPLQCVIDEMVCERLDLGEEVQIPYVKSCMTLAVQNIRDALPEKCMEIVGRRDSELAALEPAERDDRVNTMVEKIQKFLNPLCAHLEYSDPQLEQLRAYIKNQTATAACHERLVANFDQVWSLAFRPRKSCLQKRASFPVDDPLHKSRFLREVRHRVECCLDLELTETDPRTQVKESPDIPQVSLVKYLTFLAGEIRVRRTQLGLTARDRALIMMDQAGNEDGVTEVLQRSRNSMRDVLDLDELPALDTEDDAAGEKSYVWVLQKDDDVGSRMPLPPWIGQILEMRICRFVSEYQTWNRVIAQRHAKHKDLTPAQQLKYNSFQADCVQKMVFNKKKKSYIHDSASLKKNASDCIALKLYLSDDPVQLGIESATGEQFRLVWLKQEGASSSSPVPEVLNHPASEKDLPSLPKDKHAEEECDDAGDDDEVVMSEAAIREQDDQRYDIEQDVPSDEENHSDLAVLLDSDEDLEPFSLPAGTTKVKSFHLREAWKVLEGKGLTSLPRQVTGCSIGHHITSQVWQGFYPGAVGVQLGFSWGKKSKRNEQEALLKAIHGILIAHCRANPRDIAWKQQLSKVEEAQLKPP